MTGLTETQERYVRALVEAWERAACVTTRDLLERFQVRSSHTVWCHLHACIRKGYAKQVADGRYTPTLFAIETYGTVWVKRASGT